MSNRSLFEFNHDYSHRIEDDPEGFIEAIQNYLKGGDKQAANQLKKYGLKWFGMRHHSDKYDVTWGFYREEG